MNAMAAMASRTFGRGSVRVGAIDATRTGEGSVLALCCGCSDGAGACRCAKLSFSVGKRSLNWGAGKRSSNVSPLALCVFAASIPALGALPH